MAQIKFSRAGGLEFDISEGEFFGSLLLLIVLLFGIGFLASLL